MNFSITKIWDQIREQYAKMSKRAKIIALSSLGLIVISSLIISTILNNQPYETLFTGLNAQETSEIIGKLLEMNVNYKFEKDGTITVPKDQEPKTKALLVSQGYPKSGLSYDIFKENINLMSTDFEKNAFKLYDLQNRIESTIRMFDGVSSVTVNISLPEEQKYVLQQNKTEATASVHVTMQNGGSPSAEQVNAMVTLVSTSIAGLKAENVGVTDSTGKVLTNASNNAQLGAAQLKLALEQEVESSVKAKLINLLNPVYGTDKVRISVKSVVDVDKKIKEIINYVPTPPGDKGIISNESRGTEVVQNGGTVGGIVGTDTNSEVPVYPNITVNGNEVYFQSREDINYVVSQVKEQVQSDAGVLADLSVSVAISDTKPDDLQLEELKKLIAVTAGISTDTIDEKIAVYYSPFLTAADNLPQNSNPPLLSSEFIWIISGASVLVTVLLIIVLIILLKKRGKQKTDEAQPIAGTDSSDEQEDILDINLHEIKNTREMELKKQIEEFADENPEISAQLIRTWLKGEDGA